MKKQRKKKYIRAKQRRQEEEEEETLEEVLEAMKSEESEGRKRFEKSWIFFKSINSPLKIFF